MPAPVINVSQVPHYSPFRYPGGKSWFIPRLRRWLAAGERPSVFVEPFAGGGSSSCTVALEGLADHVIMVELDERVAAVWQVIFGDHADRLISRVLDFAMTSQAAEAVLRSEPTGVLDIAWRTLVQNRVSHGGIIAAGGGVLKRGEAGRGVLSRWYPETLARRIKALNSVRERVTVIHGDGLKEMQQYAYRPSTCVLLDPPYTVGGKKAGARLYTHSVIDHVKLFDLVVPLSNAVLTYDVSPEVLELAERSGLQTKRIAMKNTHHATLNELLIGHNLKWDQ